jgi:hypothetical protein
MRKLFLLCNAVWALACPVCERNQPKILKGITHGAGPESNWDYVIIWTTVAIVLFTLFFSVKWLIRPGEKSDRHIKRFILNNE